MNNKLYVAGFDRYDFINNPASSSASFTIWFSGCTHRCKGCHNKELWNRDEHKSIKVGDVYDIVHKCNIRYNVRDLVLLGGEPLQQDIDALLKLLVLCKKDGMTIWLYTGYDFDDVPCEILEHLDFIKCGKYDITKKQDGFPASSNQILYKYSNNAWLQVS